MAQTSDYTGLIPTANATKPNFVAMVTAAVQPFVDSINFFGSMVSGNFDLASAGGAQLDILGQWVGINRYWAVELSSWFEWSSPPTNQGWGQGVWWEPWEPTSGTTGLDDTTFRLMIQAKIAWNQWDGTTPTYYAMLTALFAPATVAITDNLNNSISVTVTGASVTNASLKAIATNNLLPFAPLGVTVTYTFV